MRNCEICQYVSGICLIVLSAVSSAAQPIGNQASTQTEWESVQDVFGFPGHLLPDDVMRFDMPRTDLRVTVGGTPVKPALALGGWAAFHRVADNGAMIMGDLVLTENEVAPVTNALLEGGVEVTALHNHLLGETPRVLYVHLGGHGDPVKLAEAVKKAVSLTKTPMPPTKTPQTPGNLSFDRAAVETIMGRKGMVSGGVLHFTAPRAEKLTEEGMDTPAAMGAGTAINFQPTGPGRAAVAGDFALTSQEVEPVWNTLRRHGIQPVALHSHALDDNPRLLYMHFWANNDALVLAKGLRAALDETKTAK